MPQPIICPFCNCLCDDLSLEIKDGFLSRIEPPCHLAETGFSSSLSTNIPPFPELNGGTTPWNISFNMATKLIQEAHDPLFVLSGEVSFETQEKTIYLAEHLNAYVDTPLSFAGAAIPSATNEIGLPKCSLGEMKREADMLVFWGCDLAVTHPRFIERFIRKEEDTRMFHIQSQPSEDLTGFSDNIHLKTKSNLETAIQLRLHLKNKPGELMDSLKAMLDAAQSAKFGVICFGQSLLDESKETIREVYHLIRDLNKFGLWHGLGLYDFGNWIGASEALAAKTGFGCSVRFSKDGHQFQPSNWSTEAMLLRKQTDLVIFMGNPTWLSKQALSKLADIPAILLSAKKPSWSPEVWLPIKPIGVYDSGTYFRLDGIPIELTAAVSNNKFYSAEQIIDRLLRDINR